MSRPLIEALRNQVGIRKNGKVFQIEQSRLYKMLGEAKLLEETKVPFDRPFHDFRNTVKHRIKVKLSLTHFMH